MLRSSDGEMDDTGFLQVQHTLKDHFRFFPVKEAFWRQSLRRFLLTGGMEMEEKKTEQL